MPVFYTVPRNETDELKPVPHHCNISASYFTFSFRNCQLFCCRLRHSSYSFRFLLGAKLWSEREGWWMEWMWRLCFCAASFV